MRSQQPRRATDRGAVALIVAAGLVALIGFAALALDSGHFRVVSAELQGAADAAALAAARSLDRTDAGLVLARAQAVRFAALNTADGRPVDDLDPNVGNDPAGDVVLGEWSTADRTFAPTRSAARANAARVRTARASERGSAVATWLGGLLGVDTANVRAEAIALHGAPGCAPAFPLALADCMIQNPDGSLRCDNQPIQLNPDGSDNGGLTGLDQPASVAVIRGLLDGYNPDGACTASVGEQIRLNNGNPLNALRQQFQRLLDPRGTGRNTPIVVWLPIIRTSGGGCQVRFNQSQEIAGFAAFRLEDVTPPPTQRIVGTILCGQRLRTRSGGTYFGASTPSELTY